MNSSGIMKQTDDISKVLSTFKTLAAAQVAATENGDYRKGNKAFKQVIKIIKYLKGLGRVSELEALLSDSNVGVRMFAAFGLTLSKILCKWKQDSVISSFLYLDSVFKNNHKLVHNQSPV